MSPVVDLTHVAPLDVLGDLALALDDGAAGVGLPDEIVNPGKRVQVFVSKFRYQRSEGGRCRPDLTIDLLLEPGFLILLFRGPEAEPIPVSFPLPGEVFAQRREVLHVSIDLLGRQWRRLDRLERRGFLGLLGLTSPGQQQRHEARGDD